MAQQPEAWGSSKNAQPGSSSSNLWLSIDSQVSTFGTMMLLGSALILLPPSENVVVVVLD